MANANQYRCDACGATFTSQAELVDHAKQTHASAARQQFKCSACEATFKSQAELMEHAKKHHKMPS